MPPGKERPAFAVQLFLVVLRYDHEFFRRCPVLFHQFCHRSHRQFLQHRELRLCRYDDVSRHIGDGDGHLFLVPCGGCHVFAAHRHLDGYEPVSLVQRQSRGVRLAALDDHVRPARAQPVQPVGYRIHHDGRFIPAALSILFHRDAAHGALSSGGSSNDAAAVLQGCQRVHGLSVFYGGRLVFHHGQRRIVRCPAHRCHGGLGRRQSRGQSHRLALFQLYGRFVQRQLFQRYSHRPHSALRQLSACDGRQERCAAFHGGQSIFPELHDAFRFGHPLHGLRCASGQHRGFQGTGLSHFYAQLFAVQPDALHCHRLCLLRRGAVPALLQLRYHIPCAGVGVTHSAQRFKQQRVFLCSASVGHPLPVSGGSLCFQRCPGFLLKHQL